MSAAMSAMGSKEAARAMSRSDGNAMESPFEETTTYTTTRTRWVSSFQPIHSAVHVEALFSQEPDHGEAQLLTKLDS